MIAAAVLYVLIGCFFIHLAADPSSSFRWAEEPSRLDIFLVGLLWPIILLVIIVKGRR